MKKGATRFSGILTLIISLPLLLVSLFNILSYLQIEAVTKLIADIEILTIIISIVDTLFLIVPISLFSLLKIELEAEILSLIFMGIFFVFSLFLFIWGIKEISLSCKSDERFARCKKTCGFAMFLKFMFFLYTLALVIIPFAIEAYALVFIVIDLLLGMENLHLYITIALAVIALLMFLLPTINFAVAAKKFKNQGEEFVQEGAVDGNVPNQGEVQQDVNQFQQEQPRSTMQANMPPLPNYRPQQPTQNVANPINNQQVNPQSTQQPSVQHQVGVTPVQPGVAAAQPNTTIPQQPSIAQVQPQVATQQQATAQQPAGSSIVPGQDGVPANITPKGIADLERLERLKSMGAITPDNYAAMKQKICSTEIA